MRRKSTFERPDGEFISFANTIKTQCTAHTAVWGLDTERLSKVSLLIDNATDAYNINSDTATSNRVTTTHKNATFEALKPELRLFADYLLGNPDVPDEALEIMELRTRKHSAHQPLPRPTEAPVVEVVRRHGEMTVFVSIAEHGHPTQSATRSVYHGFKLRWRFEDETMYRIVDSTRLQYTLHFDEADETKRIIMSAAWMNPRLEAGPWSEDISEVVG